MMKEWQQKLHEVIFGTDTTAGKAFDICLLWVIVISVAAVILESVSAIRLNYGGLLKTIEWVVTILFTVEYILRLSCVSKPGRYAKSFFGIVDLLSVLPAYLSLVIAGAHSLIVIRVLRLLRVFRILKLARFMKPAEHLLAALKQSRYKIGVFIGTVLSLVLILGTAMYLIEGEANGFSSIPQSMYWAIVTMTTVGYGDIAPATVLGKMLASMIMLLGYAIIVVPTGIVTFETVNVANKKNEACPHCGLSQHEVDAVYCWKCGTKLSAES